MPDLWFIGGWWFALGYGAALVALALRARRAGRRITARGATLGAADIDRYEREILGEDGDLGAARLAILDLLHDGVVAPAARWGPRREFGEATFALVAVEPLSADAHPLQREIAAAVADLPPLTAEKLFRHFARGEAMAYMCGRLARGGLLYPPRSAAGWATAQLWLVPVPYVAFFGWALTLPSGGTTSGGGIGELAVNVCAWGLAPLLALAVPLEHGATRHGRALVPAARSQPEPLLDEPSRMLVHAWETRFIGI